MNAYYRDPLQLNTSQRQEAESELKNILGNNNPKLNALTKNANALKSEIETNNVQLSSINSNISKLENEISSIKSSEESLKNQISNLSNDLTSKQSIIDGKNNSLNDLQKNLDPINSKISELETKKNDLNNNIQNQIHSFFLSKKFRICSTCREHPIFVRRIQWKIRVDRFVSRKVRRLLPCPSSI
jgi:chromosome segregation ATPase